MTDEPDKVYLALQHDPPEHPDPEDSSFMGTSILGVFSTPEGASTAIVTQSQALLQEYRQDVQNVEWTTADLQVEFEVREETVRTINLVGLPDTTGFRRAALDAPDADIEDLRHVVVSALEGDSNDADHDALVEFARFFGIEWDPDAADGGIEPAGGFENLTGRAETSLRPRLGETAEQTVDRVVSAARDNTVQSKALPLAYTVGEGLGMSREAVDEFLTGMARVNPMALIGGYSIDVAIVAFAAALGYEEGITEERIRQGTQTLIEAYFVATVG